MNLSFRVRHLFGPGGRSETMRVLTNSGVIKAAWAGNERHFTAYRERWALLLDLAGPADMPSFVSWVHLLPAALEIVIWLDEKSDTAESEYLIASQARTLINRLTRDLEAAGIDLPHGRPAHGSPSGEDIGKLGQAMAVALHGDRDELMANTAAYSGLRWGELIAATIRGLASELIHLSV